MSRDVSHAERADRRLWLSERCPTCGTQAGARCHSRSNARRSPPATLTPARRPRLATAARPDLQGRARRAGALPRAGGQPPSRTRHACIPLAASCTPCRTVWRALERAGAQSALVRFSGGGGRQPTIASVTIHAAGRELARFGSTGESELPGALAAPVWSRYGSFRGQPRITATLAWNVAERSLRLAGRRGNEHFEETLTAAAPTRHTVADVSHDTSPPTLDEDNRPPQTGKTPLTTSRASEPQATKRTCCRCEQPIAASAPSRGPATAANAAAKPPHAPGSRPRAPET